MGFRNKLRTFSSQKFKLFSFEVVLIINPNFNIDFECTYCVYLQIIKTVYQLIFEIFRI